MLLWMEIILRWVKVKHQETEKGKKNRNNQNKELNIYEENEGTEINLGYVATEE